MIHNNITGSIKAAMDDVMANVDALISDYNICTSMLRAGYGDKMWRDRGLTYAGYARNIGKVLTDLVGPEEAYIAMSDAWDSDI